MTSNETGRLTRVLMKHARDAFISQDVISVGHQDATEDMIRKGRDLERIVLARAVRAHAEDRILVFQNRTAVFT